jgi:ABC-type amino acid transport substrate-binding protein
VKLPGAFVLAVLLAASLAPAWSQTTDSDPASLTVCLQSNDPPLSVRAGNEPSGFALALSRVIAQRLGRELRMQWFVSRDDPDASLPKQANALMSYGRCQLMAEFPLVAGMLEPPRSPAAKLPPFEGATPDDRRKWVKLGELMATRPYRLDVLTVVLAARIVDRHVRKLTDLDGLKIGVQTATLPDAIAMYYGGGSLMEHVVHLRDTHDLFEELQSGDIDAAFVNLRAFDAWRLRHGSDGLAPTGYIHSVGFNMGFVGLVSNKPLIEQVDAVLADLQTHGAIEPLAASAGLSFVPPKSPDVQLDVGPAALKGD